MARSIAILIFGSPTTSFDVFRSCLFYFILFCSEPLLPRQLLLLLGAFAINATKFFVSGFLAPRSHNASNLRETDTNSNKKKGGIIKLLCAEDKAYEAAANGTLQVRLEKKLTVQNKIPFFASLKFLKTAVLSFCDMLPWSLKKTSCDSEKRVYQWKHDEDKCEHTRKTYERLRPGAEHTTLQ